MAKIKIISKGRSSTIRYIEGSLFKKTMCEFYFEFGGGDTIGTIWFPKDDSAWDTQYPWAKGRRMEIVRDMAEQVRQKQAPSSTLKWENDRVHFMSA